MKKIGLALGGGGARGFAHIPILEVFDELGVKPAYISGTSIGGIIGALYASGHSALDIAEMLHDLIVAPQKASWKELFRSSDNFKFLELFDPHFSLKPKGLIKGEKLLGFLYEQIGVDTFEELGIPLKTVATDFWRKKQVVFDSGEILPAIRASMALPYIFTPVTIDDKILVDGGLVNNVPLDILSNRCDIKIAVDVMGDSSKPADKIPNPLEAVFHTYEVMMSSIVAEKLASHPVDIYLHPSIAHADMLDFHKAEAIYEQALVVKDDFKRSLSKLLEKDASVFGWFRKK